MHDGVPKKSRPWWSVSFKSVFCLFAGFYVCAIVLLTIFEGKLVFPAPDYVGNETPADAGIAYQNLYIPVEGNGQIHAWWIPSDGPAAPVILYFHGNAEVLEQEADQEAVLFHQTGVSALLVDYRGFGKSSSLQTSGSTTRADALAGLRYLTNERHVPLQRIVLCGWSIGTGVAAQLAVDEPRVKGLVLISPITSAPDVANESWVFRVLLRPLEWLRHDNDFSTKSKIGSLHVPLLLMTGTADELAPPWMTRELWSRANEPKRMRLIDGAEHNDIMENRGGVVLDELKRFLEK